jgi:hypothetical protein
VTLLLNYLHIIFLVIAVVLAYRWRSNVKRVLWVAVATIAFLFIWPAINPNYTPKGGTPPLDNPDFTEASEDVKMEDRLRKPDVSPEQRAAEIKARHDEWQARVRGEDKKPVETSPAP